MKKTLLLIIFTIILTGCIKRDSMEDITIYTSVYPIEYITSRLYEENSTIYSIYPDGVIPNVYTLNEKQIKDYSKSNLFIFNGLSNEKNYLSPMLKNNKQIKIIDSTLNMEYNNYQEELWLDPANMLMIARNIKMGFYQYINNHYLKNEIEKKYEELKVDLSNLSAKLNLISSSSNDPTIVATSNMFKFLENYGFTVISLEENTEKNIALVKSRINAGTTKHIFVIKNQELNPNIQEIIKNMNIPTLEFHTLSNLNENDKNSKKDYLSISLENINLLKQELYK
ncbi:MAG: zinc ABC transporter substrate-binding protein [Bacilli bacterium]|nr:zinc ABC transporter substrate-binding protein [Bacilli bacterium]